MSNFSEVNETVSRQRICHQLTVGIKVMLMDGLVLLNNRGMVLSQTLAAAACFSEEPPPISKGGGSDHLIVTSMKLQAYDDKDACVFYLLNEQSH